MARKYIIVGFVYGCVCVCVCGGECVPGFTRPLGDSAMHSTKRGEFVFYKRMVWLATDCDT